MEIRWGILLSLYRHGLYQNLVEVLGTYGVKEAALHKIRWTGIG